MWVKEKLGVTANGYRISLEDNKNVLNKTVIIAKLCEYTRKKKEL